jgi:MOSC domain-containing protein YiiM
LLSELSNEGHPIFPGSVGENVLVQGIDWSSVQIGTQFHFKNVVLETTSDAPPCRTIKESFTNGDFSRISLKKYPSSVRWYAKVIRDGEIFTAESVIIN